MGQSATKSACHVHGVGEAPTLSGLEFTGAFSAPLNTPKLSTWIWPIPVAAPGVTLETCKPAGSWLSPSVHPISVRDVLEFTLLVEPAKPGTNSHPADRLPGYVASP
jgi:hypothetical protein